MDPDGHRACGYDSDTHTVIECPDVPTTTSCGYDSNTHTVIECTPGDNRTAAKSDPFADEEAYYKSEAGNYSSVDAVEMAQASIYAEQSDYQQGAAYVQSLKTPAKSQQGCSWNPLAGNSCEGQGVSILGVGAGIAGDWVSDVGKVTEKNLRGDLSGDG